MCAPMCVCVCVCAHELCRHCRALSRYFSLSTDPSKSASKFDFVKSLLAIQSSKSSSRLYSQGVHRPSTHRAKIGSPWGPHGGVYRGGGIYRIPQNLINVYFAHQIRILRGRFTPGGSLLEEFFLILIFVDIFYFDLNCLKYF